MWLVLLLSSWEGEGCYRKEVTLSVLPSAFTVLLSLLLLLVDILLLSTLFSCSPVTFLLSSRWWYWGLLLLIVDITLLSSVRCCANISSSCTWLYASAAYSSSRTWLIVFHRSLATALEPRPATSYGTESQSDGNGTKRLASLMMCSLLSKTQAMWAT